jgi:hypothetical protein
MLADERLQSPIPIYPQPPSTIQARIELEFPKAILSKRGLDDPDSPHFGNNPEANRIPMPHRECTHEREYASDSRVILSALPLVERTIQIPVSEALRQWLEPNQRKYDPDPGGLFLPIEGCKPRLDGILCEERLDLERNRYEKYLLILESGYVEMGEVLVYHSRDRTYFAFTPMIARLWQFINFVLDLYAQNAGEGQFIVILNMINTLGSMLALLGKGWMEPGVKDVLGRTFDPATSHHNIQIASAPLGVDLQPEDVFTLVRQIAQRVDYAYGVWNLRAFNHPNFGDPSSLNPSYIRW